MRTPLVDEQAEDVARYDRIDYIPTGEAIARCHRCGEVVVEAVRFHDGVLFLAKRQDEDAPAIRPQSSSKLWKIRHYWVDLEAPSARHLPAALPLFCGRHAATVKATELRTALAMKKSIRV